MIYYAYASLLIGLAGLPLLMVLRNLRLFHRAPPVPEGPLPKISVLIPARNEEANIGDSLQAILRNQHVEFEVLVLDDHSDDQTAAIVDQLAERDPRVRCLAAPELPSGWNGKQHACWQLAQAAQYDWLLFVDADVRLSEGALARLLAEQQRSSSPLISGFPHQITGTLAEQLMIPLMYYLLLGYLPLDQMRTSPQPAFAAGCGQLFLARRDAYLAAGGHSAIRQSRHDGLQLPRAFRRAGFSTDLFDASDLARVRMYSGWSSVVQGLLKNATEGIAQPKLIGVFTVLLLGGSVLPLLSWGHAWYHAWPTGVQWLLLLATLMSFAPRALLTWQMRQGWWGVSLHPLAVAVFVGLQWLAAWRHWCGLPPISWKGRS